MNKLLIKFIVFIFAIAISLSCGLLWEKLNTKPQETVEFPKELVSIPLDISPKIRETSNSDICKEIDAWKKEFGILIRPTKKTINGGVLNSKACLIEPVFPDDKQVKGLDTKVLVEVLLNENGKIVKAQAIKGDPIFYRAAEKAAYKSRFKQFFLRGEPIRVKGFLQYDFVSQ